MPYLSFVVGKVKVMRPCFSAHPQCAGLNTLLQCITLRDPNSVESIMLVGFIMKIKDVTCEYSKICIQDLTLFCTKPLNYGCYFIYKRYRGYEHTKCVYTDGIEQYMKIDKKNKKKNIQTYSNIFCNDTLGEPRGVRAPSPTVGPGAQGQPLSFFFIL